MPGNLTIRQTGGLLMAISPLTYPRLKAWAFTLFKPHCICLLCIPLKGIYVLLKGVFILFHAQLI